MPWLVPGQADPCERPAARVDTRDSECWRQAAWEPSPGPGWPAGDPLCDQRHAFGIRERAEQLLTGGDAELGEDLPKMPFDGARAQVQLAADLGVRASLTREHGDLLLL